MIKSLEIVNLILEDNQDCFIMQDVTSYDMETIKQDLEILEIIKRNTSIESVDAAICWYKESSKISTIDFKDKIEDYTRIKQWLEGKENETK